MKIVANHAHIFQEEIRRDGSIQVLKEVMDQCSIDRVVCFAPFADCFRSNGESPNKWLYEQIKDSERFLAFGTIDFTKDNLKEQAEEIYNLGFAGIKMNLSHQGIKVDGERACEVYSVAEKYGMPISFHTGIHFHRMSDYNTLLYDEVAYKFPELKICMEHVGGYAFFYDAMGVLSNNPKTVYAGLTSVFDPVINKPWYLGKEKIKEIMWLAGMDRCIFGLDFPHNPVGKIKEAMHMLNECIDEMGLGEEAVAKVFGGNLLKMIERK